MNRRNLRLGSFDLGLLGIHPETLTVELDPQLLEAGYGAFSGISLFLNGNDGPDKGALEERWSFFVGAGPNAAALEPV